MNASTPMSLREVVEAVHYAARRGRVARTAFVAGVEPADVAQDALLRAVTSNAALLAGKPGTPHQSIIMVSTRNAVVEVYRYRQRRADLWHPMEQAPDLADDAASAHELLEEREAVAKEQALLARVRRRGERLAATPRESLAPEARRESHRVGAFLAVASGMSLTEIAALSRVELSTVSRRVDAQVLELAETARRASCAPAPAFRKAAPSPSRAPSPSPSPAAVSPEKAKRAALAELTARVRRGGVLHIDDVGTVGAVEGWALEVRGAGRRFRVRIGDVWTPWTTSNGAARLMYRSKFPRRQKPVADVCAFTTYPRGVNR